MAHDHGSTVQRIISNCTRYKTFDGYFHDPNDESLCPLNLADEFDPPYRNGVLLAHGVVMAVVFLGLLPVGALAAKARHYKLHGLLQLCAIGLALVGFVLAAWHTESGVPLTGPNDGHGVNRTALTVPWKLQHEDGGSSAGATMAANGMRVWHVRLGLLVCFLLCLEALGGALLYRQAAWCCCSRVLLHVNARVRRYLAKMHSWGAAAVLLLGIALAVPSGVALYSSLCSHGRANNCLGHWGPAMPYTMYGLWAVAAACGVTAMPSAQHRLGYYESWVLIISGVINTILQHDWSQAWSHGDMQHAVTGGLLSIVCGALGLTLETLAQRRKYAWMAHADVFPAVFYVLTGVVMVNHAQPRVFQILVHQYWGVLLILGGLLRALFMVPVCLQNGWLSPPLERDESLPATEGCVRIGLFVLGVAFVLIGCVFAGSMKPLLLMAEVAFEADTTPYLMLLMCCGLGLLLYELLAIACWQWMISKRTPLSGSYELVSLDATDEDTLPPPVSENQSDADPGLPI